MFREANADFPALIVGTRGRSKLQNWGMALGGTYFDSMLMNGRPDIQRRGWVQYRDTPFRILQSPSLS